MSDLTLDQPTSAACGITPPTGDTVTLPVEEFDDWREALARVRHGLNEFVEERWSQFVDSGDPAARELTRLERGLQHVWICMAEVRKAANVPLRRIDGPGDVEEDADTEAELDLVLFMVTDPYRLNLSRSLFDADQTLGETLEAAGVTQDDMVQKVDDYYIQRPMAVAMVRRVWRTPNAAVRALFATLDQREREREAEEIEREREEQAYRQQMQEAEQRQQEAERARAPELLSPVIPDLPARYPAAREIKDVVSFRNTAPEETVRAHYVKAGYRAGEVVHYYVVAGHPLPDHAPETGMRFLAWQVTAQVSPYLVTLEIPGRIPPGLQRDRGWTPRRIRELLGGPEMLASAEAARE
jgi:hypothetical protein